LTHFKSYKLEVIFEGIKQLESFVHVTSAFVYYSTYTVFITKCMLCYETQTIVYKHQYRALSWGFRIYSYDNNDNTDNDWSYPPPSRRNSKSTPYFYNTTKYSKESFTFVKTTRLRLFMYYSIHHVHTIARLQSPYNIYKCYITISSRDLGSVEIRITLR